MAPPRSSTFWCLVLVLAILELASSAVYETDDAIIIDLEEPSAKATSSSNKANSADSSGTRTSRSLVNTNEVVFTRQFGAGSWPPVLPVGPCFTSRGILGRCTSFRQCYPYFKLPELNNWETWILGMYDTCSYFNSNGRQAFGVCCSNPTFPSTPRPGQPSRPTPPPAVEAPEPPSTEAPMRPVTEAVVLQPEPAPPVNPSQGVIPSNWPPPIPPIPTHPPDHTIPPLPTHPPSPGWPGLPEPAPTQPAKPPSAPATTTTTTTTTKTPARPPQRPTVFPSWPPPIPTHPPARPPVIPTNPPIVRPPALPAQPPTPTVASPPTTQAAPGTGGAILIDASCGAKINNQDSERIVGGHNADQGEWPWIAALFNGGRQFCGGSLIDSTHILSAAHCIAHMTSWDVSRLTVRLGDYNIKSNTETQHVERKVKRIVRHKGFDSRTLYNDIAILTLDSPVTYSKTIKPICLPTGSNLYNGKDATVVGWGSLRESGPQPAVLQEVTIPIWTNAECRSKYGNAAPGGIVEHFVCAGQAGRDSCSGDSGGPLMVNEGRWTQVGVVSWGIGCGKGQYPGVYTRVTHFLPWIQKNLT